MFTASTPPTPPPLPPTGSPESLAAAPKPVARWRWWIHLLLITAFPVLSGALSMLRSESAEPALSSSVRGLLWASAWALLVFGVLFVGAWLASRVTSDQLLMRWRQGFWPIPLGIGYSIALRLALGIVVVIVAFALIVCHVVSTEELQQIVQERAPDVGSVVDVSSLRKDPAYFWIMITFVSFVVAGLREELWRAAFIAGMRGLWPRRFATRRAQLIAVLIAAVIFGIGHAAQGAMGATLAGLLGLGLGVIMVLHRSIWPAVIAHGCIDATSFALLPWAMEKMQELQHTLPH